MGKISFSVGVGAVSLPDNPDILPLPSDTALHVNLANMKNLGVKLILEICMGTLKNHYGKTREDKATEKDRMWKSQKVYVSS